MAEPKYKVGDLLFFTNEDGGEQISEVVYVHLAGDNITYQFRAMGHYGGFVNRPEEETHDMSLRQRISRIERMLNL